MLLFMLPLQMGGVKVPWSHPMIPSLFAVGAVVFMLFLATEIWWAAEPVFPIRLLKRREVLASYVIVAGISAAQTGVSTFNCEKGWQRVCGIGGLECLAELNPAAAHVLSTPLLPDHWPGLQHGCWFASASCRCR